MTSILSLFYLFLFLGVSVTGLYVTYHILRYSISKQSAALTAAVFAAVLLFLLSANVVFFYRIDWETLLGESLSAGASPSHSPY